MSISERKVANAIGGKTARACDSCLRKRARWFCSADDAFLCQSCDTSVHSANQLASRHERVRLNTSSCKETDKMNSCIPAWHQGFTRKARTPRHAKHTKSQQLANQLLPFVPEINGEESFFCEENDQEQFPYSVPVMDFANDFCIGDGEEGDGRGTSGHILVDEEEICRDLNLEELLTCDDAELEVFATDVESLLATGVEEDQVFRINDVRMETVDYDQEENEVDEVLGGEKVKVEEEDGDEEVQAVIACQFDPALDMELNWDFDYAPSLSTEELDEEEIKKVVDNKTTENAIVGSESQVEKKMFLRLNYEAVIAAWATQGSPWTNGIRPEFNLEEFTAECLGGSSHPYGGTGGRSSVDDAERQARVSRYREKRRTRLFAKKIRYEVRKLNAEKRPRMKGRFVKRTSLTGSCLPYLLKK